jgi:hypothetical protein
MSRYFRSLVIVDPAEIPPSAPQEKKELLKILKEAQANGEINLAEFGQPKGTATGG